MFNIFLVKARNDSNSAGHCAIISNVIGRFVSTTAMLLQRHQGCGLQKRLGTTQAIA